MLVKDSGKANNSHILDKYKAVRIARQGEAEAVSYKHLLHFGGKDLHAGIAHGWGELHSGNLLVGGAVLLWLTVIVRPFCLHWRHGEDGRRAYSNTTRDMVLIQSN